MEKEKKLVELAFREITKLGHFDVVKGNEPIPIVANDPMSVIPGKMTDYVNECGYGCCFVFSAYMIELLNRLGINNCMIATIEDGGMRASVMYEINGELFVANPVEDIEYFTYHNIDPENRKDYYDKESATMTIDGQSHNDACYTLDEFTKKYGKTCIIGSMSENVGESLNDAMMTKGNRIIYPPEDANCNAKEFMQSL